MKLTNRERYEDEGILTAPEETRFNPDKPYGNPDEIHRYRCVCVIGCECDNSLPLDVNMLLTHNEAKMMWKAMRGEINMDDKGGWGRRCYDIAYDVSRAAMEDRGLFTRVKHILWNYVCQIDGVPEDYEIGLFCSPDALREDLEMLDFNNPGPNLPLLLQFLMLETRALTFFTDSLEICDEPMDEYDFLLEYEDTEDDQYYQQYLGLAKILHPEAVGDDADPSITHTITIVDAADNRFEGVPVSYSEYHKKTTLDGKTDRNLFLNTQTSVASYLAEKAIADDKYLQLIEAFDDEMAKALRALSPDGNSDFSALGIGVKIDRSTMSEDEIYSILYRKLLLVHCWYVIDEQTGQAYKSSHSMFSFGE